ncbi:hypothetical protein WN55_04082 [Dufourea novaeangliae]|uniref:Uncharacterized protein n=1 Tax=Dufourea novaeangliae TaxID=178035 RepID=A0A154PKV3_DUFNO|nr:hypothetical protein WN55_04082 [Dufourea novaeangliae]
MTNLERLKGCLAGYPDMLTRNMPLKETNCTSAWTVLQSLYNNKRILVQHQLNHLEALPLIRTRSVEELKALRTWDTVTALTVLGHSVDRSADWLVPQTVNRLDEQTRMKWQLSLGTTTEPTSLDRVKSFLDARILAVEAASCIPVPRSATSHVCQRSQSRCTSYQQKIRPVKPAIFVRDCITFSVAYGTRT